MSVLWDSPTMTGDSSDWRFWILPCREVPRILLSWYKICLLTLCSSRKYRDFRHKWYIHGVKRYGLAWWNRDFSRKVSHKKSSQIHVWYITKRFLNECCFLSDVVPIPISKTTRAKHRTIWRSKMDKTSSLKSLRHSLANQNSTVSPSPAQLAELIFSELWCETKWRIRRIPGSASTSIGGF